MQGMKFGQVEEGAAALRNKVLSLRRKRHVQKRLAVLPRAAGSRPRN